MRSDPPAVLDGGADRDTGSVPRQILLSYAREDAAVVTELAADLRVLDHVVWLDQDLSGGQDWWNTILARIRWCDAFLPVLSTAYLGSRACTGERSYAVALNRPIVPVAVGELGPEGLLDEDLARRQRIAYLRGDKRSTLRLLGAMQRLVPAPPLPTVEPTPPPVPMVYLGALRQELDGAGAVDFHRQLVLLGLLQVEADDKTRNPEVAALVQMFLARRDVAAHVERQLKALQKQVSAVRFAAASASPIPSRPAASTARPAATGVPPAHSNQAIRDWARKRGMKLSDRGRIPAEVLEAYHMEN